MEWLKLDLAVASGDERACALFLRSQLPASRWEILVALAAELVSIHESASSGATRVLVVPEAPAEKLLADLVRK